MQCRPSLLLKGVRPVPQENPCPCPKVLLQPSSVFTHPHPPSLGKMEHSFPCELATRQAQDLSSNRELFRVFFQTKAALSLNTSAAAALYVCINSYS